MPNGPIAILGGSTGNGPQSIGNGKSIPWFVTRYLRRNEGSTDYATIPTVTLSGDFVVEFDALADDADVAGALVGYGANTNNNVFISGRDISIRDNNSDTVFTTGDAFSSSIFNHVMIQKVGANVNITINGVLSGSGTSSGSFITDQLCSRQNGALSFSGILANLRIYDNGTLIRDYPLNDNSNILANRATVLGDELLALGNPPNAAWSVDYNTGNVSKTAVNSDNFDIAEVIMGRTYLLSVKKVSLGAGSPNVRINSTQVIFPFLNSTQADGETFEFLFTASVSGLLGLNGSGAIFEVTNLSIKEADGYGLIVNGTADQWQVYQKQSTGEWLGPELWLGTNVSLGGAASVIGSSLVFSGGLGGGVISLGHNGFYRMTGFKNAENGRPTEVSNFSDNLPPLPLGSYEYNSNLTEDLGIIHSSGNATTNENISVKEVLNVA
jgi:hypothetical protein